MSLDIYNEGRVVGYSAYETYIKQFLSENPTGTPATEREWLSSMLASGASLMLRIDADTDDSLHVRDIALPTDSKLRAANFIMANYTNVEVASADRDYPTKVASYSDNLVPNSTSNHPTSGYHTADTLPIATNLSEQIDTEAIKNYFKIKDGVVLQDGTWFDNPTLAQPPRMGFTPDMTKTPIVRLLIDGRITQPFYILLTGFTDVTVLEGTTGIQDSQLTHAPENGDYLGPATFPWAGKIIFGISSQIAERYFASDEFTRKLPSTSVTATAKNVTGGIIDYADADLNWYDTYLKDNSGGKYKDSTVVEYITKENIDEGVGVLTAYSRFEGAPPAIYGSVVDKTGDKKLAPLDVITPGTVKIFDDKAELEAYLNNTPNVYAFFKDTSSGEPVLQFATEVKEGTYQYTTLGGKIGIIQANIHGANVWVVDLGNNQYGLALTSNADNDDKVGKVFPNPSKYATYSTATVANDTERGGKGRLYWFDIFKCIKVNTKGEPDIGGTHAGWVDVWGDKLRGLNQYIHSVESNKIQLNDNVSLVSLRIDSDATGWSLHTKGPAEFAIGEDVIPYIKIGTKRLFLAEPPYGASNGDIGIW